MSFLVLVALLVFQYFYYQKVPRAFLIGIHVLAFLALLVGIQGLVKEHSVFRWDSAAPVMKKIVESSPSTDPGLLLVGSSMTALGINGDSVGQLLKGQAQVLQFSHAGMYNLEQAYYLKEIFSRIQRPPRYLVWEVGRELDLSVILDNRGSDRIIEYHDWDITLRELRAVGGVELAFASLEHFLYRFLHLGGAQSYSSFDDLRPRNGFRSRDDRKLKLTEPEVNAELATISSPEKLTPTDQKIIWDFYSREWNGAKAAGVEKIIFFSPPQVNSRLRARGEAICKLLSPIGSCFHFNRADLITRLPFSDWRDEGHLNFKGAARFTPWFSEELKKFL